MKVGRKQATNIGLQNSAQQSVSGKLLFWGIVIFGITVVAVTSIWIIPLYIFEPHLAGSHMTEAVILKAETDFRKSIIDTIQTITGIFTASGLVFTIYYAARNVAIGERSSAMAARMASDNLQATLDGKITDRFAKAIEQLGTDSIAVRVGAIYALERIARDSIEDHWPVMELLCSLLREMRPAGRKTSESAVPPEDVRVIAAVLRRRKSDRETDSNQLDLSRANLSGLNFTDVIMRNANFDSSDLVGTRFDGGDLTGATFANAKASQAGFRKSKLVGAFLNGADFTGANMEGANLREATTNNAVFSQVIGPIVNVTQDQQSAARVWLTIELAPAVSNRT
jgi:hypothetical protein